MLGSIRGFNLYSKIIENPSKSIKSITSPTPLNFNRFYTNSGFQLTDTSGFKKIDAYDAHWLVRRMTGAILVDTRPKREHEAYHIFGSHNITPHTPLSEFSDIPLDRPVLLYGSGEKGDTAVYEVYERMTESQLKHPDVAIIKGTPDIIRENGFIYFQNVPEWEKIIEEKRLAAAEAAKK